MEGGLRPFRRRTFPGRCHGPSDPTPEEDPHQIVIDLDFDSTAPAHAFAALLHERVWGTGNSPALVGAPTTRVLVEWADYMAPRVWAALRLTFGPTFTRVCCTDR